MTGSSPSFYRVQAMAGRPELPRRLVELALPTDPRWLSRRVRLGETARCEDAMGSCQCRGRLSRMLPGAIMSRQRPARAGLNMFSKSRPRRGGRGRRRTRAAQLVRCPRNPSALFCFLPTIDTQPTNCGRTAQIGACDTAQIGFFLTTLPVFAMARPRGGPKFYAAPSPERPCRLGPHPRRYPGGEQGQLTSIYGAGTPSSLNGAPISMQLNRCSCYCRGPRGDRPLCNAITQNAAPRARAAWCRPLGFSWQTPRASSEAMDNPDRAAATRANGRDET